MVMHETAVRTNEVVLWRIHSEVVGTHGALASIGRRITIFPACVGAMCACQTSSIHTRAPTVLHETTTCTTDGGRDASSTVARLYKI